MPDEDREDDMQEVEDQERHHQDVEHCARPSMLLSRATTIRPIVRATLTGLYISARQFSSACLSRETVRWEG